MAFVDTSRAGMAPFAMLHGLVQSWLGADAGTNDKNLPFYMPGSTL